MAKKGPKPLSLSQKLWRFVERTDGESNCWLWMGPVNNKGYGVISFATSGRLLAHRASWLLAHGDIPNGLCVCHRCDTPRCVRPNHLFLATQAENLRDMAAKGRSCRDDRHWTHKYPELLKRGDNNPMRQHPESWPYGERNKSAKLTADQVIEMRAEYAVGQTTYQLMEKYHISRIQVQRIVRGRAWCHLLEREEQ